MKILILLSRIDQTGVTTNTLDLVSGLIDEKQKVFVVTGGPSEENNLRLDAIFEDFKKVGTQIRMFKIPKGNYISKAFTSIFSILKIMYYIHMIKPNVIHAQSPYMSFIPWLMRKKFISTLHVNDFVKSFKYKNATHLIAISRETKQYAIDLFNYKEEDITVVNHGISENYAISMSQEEKTKFKLENKIPIDKLIIGFVGSIEKRKGHDLLLKAVQILDDSLKKKIHIVFLGSSKDNTTRPWLDNLIKTTNTSHLVSCFDYQDPKPFYAMYDIFVLPSRLEGFPLVVIEAMMSECCVIRSNVQGAYDQIDHGINGFIFENNDFMELAKILARVIENKTLMLEIAKKGKEKALSKFTIEAMTKGTLDVYKNIIS